MMHITRAPRGHLLIDDATLIFKNFSGKGDRFNREGDKNFSIRIFDPEDADMLLNDVNEDGIGWNVKVKPPREEGEDPFMHLKVKVRFNARGPKVVLISGDNKIELDEDSIRCLDTIDIERVDLDIRPYDDFVNGKPFRAAYLDKMYVVQSVDRYLERYGI